MSASASLAGEVAGSLVFESAGETEPVAARVDVVCVKKTAYTTSASILGIYSVKVEETGNCSMSVHYAGQAATLEVISQKKSVRYDLVLKFVDGKLTVARR